MEITPEELKGIIDEGLSPALSSLNTALESFSKSFDNFISLYERLRDENQKLKAESKKADEKGKETLQSIKHLGSQLGEIRLALSKLGLRTPIINGGGH